MRKCTTSQVTAGSSEEANRLIWSRPWSHTIISVKICTVEHITVIHKHVTREDHRPTDMQNMSITMSNTSNDLNNIRDALQILIMRTIATNKKIATVNNINITTTRTVNVNIMGTIIAVMTTVDIVIKKTILPQRNQEEDTNRMKPAVKLLMEILSHSVQTLLCQEKTYYKGILLSLAYYCVQ